MKPKGFDSCEQVKSIYEIYEVRVAAALWCDVPDEELNQILSQAREVSAGIWSSPYIKCLEVRCRAIQIAINKKLLPVCRENGEVVEGEDHVAPARRRVRGQDLRKWIAENFPNDKPAFLFDEIERSTHTAINSEAFKALQVDRDATKLENEKLRKLNQELSSERDGLKYQIASMESYIEQLKKNNLDAVSARQRRTFLVMIAALCNQSNINYSERGAAQRIAELTEVVGAPITDDTIRGILSEIEDAIESRQK